jgi:ketosteroid isomerase-like protein
MSTTTEQNKAIIRRFFDAWNGRQPDAFDDLIAPDVVRHCEATPGVEARRLDQIKEFLRQDKLIPKALWQDGAPLFLAARPMYPQGSG